MVCLWVLSTIFWFCSQDQSLDVSTIRREAMPTPPREGETRKEFIARCAEYMADNHPEKDHDEALAICHSMWEQSYMKKMKEKTK